MGTRTKIVEDRRRMTWLDSRAQITVRPTPVRSWTFDEVLDYICGSFQQSIGTVFKHSLATKANQSYASEST